VFLFGVGELGVVEVGELGVVEYGLYEFGELFFVFVL